MRLVLRDDFREFEVVRWERAPVIERALEFRDRRAAEQFLRSVGGSGYGAGVLRGFLAGELRCRDVTGWTEAEVLAQMAAQMASGFVKVVPCPPRRRPLVLDMGKPEAPVPVLETKKTKSWVRFEVVEDDTGRPLPGVALVIRLPDGKEGQHPTNANGMVVFEKIDPGTCNVRCELAGARLSNTYDFVAMGQGAAGGSGAGGGSDGQGSGGRIAKIESHKVQTGEALDGMATGAGMTWQELALFNWGTSTPDEINLHLRDDVGCTKKTADGHNYRFDSSDEPGIVYIPRPWSQPGLPTDQTHTFRVRSVEGLRLWVRLDVDPDIAAEREDRFVLTSTDGSYRVEKTVKDDQIPFDDYVDLHYSGLKRGGRYTLQVTSPNSAEPEIVFEDIPYEELAGLSPAAPELNEPTFPCPGEEDPYPADPEDPGVVEETTGGEEPPDSGETYAQEQQQGGAA